MTSVRRISKKIVIPVQQTAVRSHFPLGQQLELSSFVFSFQVSSYLWLQGLVIKFSYGINSNSYMTFSLAMQYWYYRRHKFFFDESWIIAYDKIQRGKAIMSVLFQESMLMFSGNACTLHLTFARGL